MPIATVAIDLAKDVFEIAAADQSGKIIERRRLTRGTLEPYVSRLREVHIVMEACVWDRALLGPEIRSNVSARVAFAAALRAAVCKAKQD